MATLRTSSRFFSSAVFRLNTATRCLLNAKVEPRVVQQRFIARKEHLDPEVVALKPKPWPYETKKYTNLRDALWWDSTLARFDENTKIITVDGLVGAGKEKFAKQLAEITGMKYVPEPDIDSLFIDHNGFDYRCLNSMLPEQGQFYDLKMFHNNPYHYWCGYLQFTYMKQRAYHYLNALAHLYNTGQGIVMVRSPWSDIVFMESLFKHGYVFKDTYNYYHRARVNTLWEYQRPHLQIFLDISPELALQRIKSKPNSMEAKSKVLNLEFLKTLDDEYKNNFLPEINQSSVFLAYDWSTEGDMDEVIEDLEKLDFDQYSLKGDKLEDWRMYPEFKFTEMRMFYTNNMEELAAAWSLPTYDVEGMSQSNDAAEILNDLVKHYVPNKYDEWHDPKKHGWSKVLLTRGPNYREDAALAWNPVRNWIYGVAV